VKVIGLVPTSTAEHIRAMYTAHNSAPRSNHLLCSIRLPPAFLTRIFRSAIFYHSEAQKQAAEEVIAAVQPKFGSKIVTEVAAASEWYPADKGHQDYYSRNKSRCVLHTGYMRVRHVFCFFRAIGTGAHFRRPA